MTACEAWLERHRECDALSTRAELIESYLVERCHWHLLSNRRRAAIPQAFELDAIDDRRDELQMLNEELLERIPAMAATTAYGVIAKLMVAVACMPGAEHGPAQHLVRSALNDLQSLAGASGRLVQG